MKRPSEVELASLRARLGISAYTTHDMWVHIKHVEERTELKRSVADLQDSLDGWPFVVHAFTLMTRGPKHASSENAVENAAWYLAFVAHIRTEYKYGVALKRKHARQRCMADALDCARVWFIFASDPASPALQQGRWKHANVKYPSTRHRLHLQAAVAEVIQRLRDTK